MGASPFTGSRIGFGKFGCIDIPACRHLRSKNDSTFYIYCLCCEFDIGSLHLSLGDFQRFSLRRFKKGQPFHARFILVRPSSEFSSAFSIFREDFLSLKLFQIFFLTMGIERLATEAYKMFFRREDQSKYFIPSRLTFFGKDVKSEVLRYSLGIASFAPRFLGSFDRMDGHKLLAICSYWLRFRSAGGIWRSL